MRIVNEEKHTLIADNQTLTTQLSETGFEFQKLERDLKDFMCFRQAEFGEYAMNPDPVAQNTHRLV